MLFLNTGFVGQFEVPCSFMDVASFDLKAATDFLFFPSFSIPDGADNVSVVLVQSCC